ncbi:MAG: Glu/Leu/Phe/Val dehydrogenase [Porticoccus sp.]
MSSAISEVQFEPLKFSDDLGPLKVIHVHEPITGLKATLVVDNVARGPSIGGVRMAPDVSTEECFRLARAMTLKNAAADLPHGGGKAVLYGDPSMPKKEKEQLIRAMACSLAEVEQYIFAPDMGTDEECMGWVNDEIGRVVGLPKEVGGIPLDEIGATGWGLLNAIKIATEFQGWSLSGARIAIQGFGAVGRHTARFLTDNGAILVAAADSGGTVTCADGLDVASLLAIKASGGSVIDYERTAGVATANQDAIVDIPCDIWIPAARPDVIHANNVDRLQARMVVEAANIPITLDAERRLHEKGVLCIPDFIANAGGVICAAMEYQGANQVAAFQSIEDKLRHNVKTVLEQSERNHCLPRQAAVQMAVTRVKKAMKLRRWHLF